MASPVRAPTATDTSTTVTTSEAAACKSPAGFPLNLSHSEVILGLNNVETAVETATTVSGAIVCSDRPNEVGNIRNCSQNRVNDGVNLSSVSAQFPQSQPTHYYQHTNFGSQPFNHFAGPIPYNVSSQSYHPYHSASSSKVTQYDPYMMTYSGPYNAMPAVFSTMPTPTLPFAVPTYLNAQAAMSSSFVSPTFATSISPAQNQPGVQPQNAPYPYNQFPHNQFHTHYADNNLPTMKQMRLEFSVFSGGDPVEWLNKAEQYFELYQIPEDKKLSIATMHLSDKASNRWYMFRHEFPNNWQGLADFLMREFGGFNKSDYQAALARMIQTGSVEHYKEQFTRLSRRAPGFSQELLLSCFIGGLKDEIRVDVKAQKPRTLYDACELARVFEERYEGHRTHARGIVGNRTPIVHSSVAVPRVAVPTPSLRPLVSNQGGNRPSTSTNGNRRLSQAEYQDRRARNQCFFCDETFKPGHNCRKGQVMIMKVVQEEIDMPIIVEVETEGEESPAVSDIEEPLIKLQVLSDLSTIRTMQLKGVFNKRLVHVLVDSGATHNFIHPTLLKNLKSPVSNLLPLNVMLASGARMKTQGEVSVTLQLQQYEFSADFYILPISGCEIILGASWLKSLGDILWNFENMIMKFSMDGREYQLQGELQPHTTVVSCKAMTRLLRKEKEAMLIQVSPVAECKTIEAIHPQIQTLIHKYAEIFETPKSLPPSREQDHRIELIPNTSPVSVRPYRYPHFQKAEIEKIVQELLDNGVIRPSVSPFSSPVILVKKKDATWRMCVDYRALNTVTVKDKYPIPVVDELLDEIHGSAVFTKLDLRSGYHQIRMYSTDISKTAFRTHSGHYEFLVMPFGLTNAPSTFQSVMNDVLREFLREFVLVFFDDILIYSPSIELHIEHLEQVFKKLQQHSLKVKESKCSLALLRLNIWDTL